jgi:hypothetical protein
MYRVVILLLSLLYYEISIFYIYIIYILNITICWLIKIPLSGIFFNSLQGPLDRSPYIIFSQQSIFDPHLRDIARRCQATRSPWSPPRPPAAVVPMSQSHLPR